MIAEWPGRTSKGKFYPFYHSSGWIFALSKIDLWKFGRLGSALSLTVLLTVRFFSFIKSFPKKIDISKFHFDHWDQRLGSITSRCSGKWARETAEIEPNLQRPPLWRNKQSLRVSDSWIHFGDIFSLILIQISVNTGLQLTKSLEA